MKYYIGALLLALSACVMRAPSCDMGAQYLGAKYISDPLGEEKLPDTDPLIRFDAFDCTTFVETVLANGDKDALNKIRYAGGEIAFENRNHFIETDWLTNNAAVVENASARYGDTDVRRVLIDKRAWGAVVHGVQIDAQPVMAELEYIPYYRLGTIRNDAPLIVLFVVAPRESNAKLATDIAVVHMGFLLPGGRVLRHASTGRGVVDDDFGQYVEMRKKMKNNIGITVVKIK